MTVASGRKSWQERSEEVHLRFPALRNLDWDAELERNPDTFARLLRDILKLDAATPGRSGPRPVADWDTGMARLRQLMGADYATVPFPDAFAALLHWQPPQARSGVGTTGGKPGGTLSLTAIARKTGIGRSQLHRLLCGQTDAEVEEMERVAGAFGKHGSYFLEYRVAYVTATVAARLHALPEASIDMYRRLTRPA